MSDDDSNESFNQGVSQGETNKTKELVELLEEIESQEKVRTKARRVSRWPSWYKVYMWENLFRYDNYSQIKLMKGDVMILRHRLNEFRMQSNNNSSYILQWIMHLKCRDNYLFISIVLSKIIIL